MRVLFLDVDGVLNSVKWLSTKDATDDIKERIDPLTVEKVNRIVHETGATVVLSSSVKDQLGISGANHILKGCGAEFELSSCTPTLIDSFSDRQEEIAQWLENQNITAFAVLDDDDLPDFKDHHVQVDYNIGLTNEDAEKAVTILSRPKE